MDQRITERMRWKVLKAFCALPSEPRVKDMTPKQFVWCFEQMMADRQEELDGLCPPCLEAVTQPRCLGCGAPLNQTGGNPQFDSTRFSTLEEGGGD